jgi:Caspase domain/Domain of unknown function (DUF4384)
VRALTRLVFVSLLVLLISFGWHARAYAESAPPAAAAVKRALLVGINNYRSVPGLQGSVNDVETMREILVTRWGFAAANIKMLTDEAATRAGILAALEQLVREAGPDDIVYFHYSGHGSQVEDLNGDEADGLDETIVPQDGRSPNVADIVDDELDAIFARLKTRNAVIVLDSCHSGTATRAIDIRARSIPQDKRIDLYQSENGGTHTRAIVPVMSSRYVVMSAASPTEEALDGPVEGRYHGFFTYALAKSISAARDGASAREIFSGVARELTRIQAQFGRTSMPEPQLEASNAQLDQPLLSPVRAPARDPSQAPRLAWLVAQPTGPAEVTLLRGVLLGAVPGSAWAIYPPVETAFLPGHALGVATVVQLRGSDAVGRLQPGGRAIVPGARAIALMPAPVSGTISIGVQNVPAARRKEIAATLSRNIRNVSIAEPDAPARFMVDLQGDSIRLLTAEGLQVVGVFPLASGQWGASVAQAVARMANAADLLGLDNQSAQMAVRANIAGRPSLATRGIAVVADTQPAQLHVRRQDEPRSPQNSLQLEIEVSADAYLTVVDVDSEGGVNLLFPNDYQQHSFHGDGAVRAGERVLIPDSLQAGNRAGFYWDYSPPRGVDTLRVFATTDLAMADTIRQRVRAMRQSAAQAPGVAARAISQDVGNLRTELTHLATRDIIRVADQGTSAAAPSDWSATSLTVVVSDGT